MIKYETLKQLKEKGFLLPIVGCHECDEGKTRLDGDEGTLWIPTLSELIEECGPLYVEDGKVYEFALLLSNGEWFAGYMDQDFNRPKQLSDGRSGYPDEAVAMLYLLVKEKQV